MAVKRPSVARLQEVARSLGIHLTDEHFATYNTLLQPNFDAYDLIDSLPDFVPKVTYPRTPGYRPGSEENKYGAWYIKTTIKGAAKGKLAGKTVAIKDNVCVAGAPTSTALLRLSYSSTRATPPKAANASTWPRRKLSIWAFRLKRRKMRRE